MGCTFVSIVIIFIYSGRFEINGENRRPTSGSVRLVCIEVSEECICSTFFTGKRTHDRTKFHERAKCCKCSLRFGICARYFRFSVDFSFFKKNTHIRVTDMLLFENNACEKNPIGFVYGDVVLSVLGIGGQIIRGQRTNEYPVCVYI